MPPRCCTADGRRRSLPTLNTGRGDVAPDLAQRSPSRRVKLQRASPEVALPVLAVGGRSPQRSVMRRLRRSQQAPEWRGEAGTSGTKYAPSAALPLPGAAMPGWRVG